MNKTIGALIGAALLAMPSAAFAQYYDYSYSPGYTYGDQCYCSGQGGFYRDPVLYGYSAVYGYGGQGYDQNGNFGLVPPTYASPSYSYSQPQYYQQQPQYSYPSYSYPSYNYPQYQPYQQYQPTHYYPQQQYYPQQYNSYPYLYNTNTNNINVSNALSNYNIVYGW